MNYFFIISVRTIFTVIFSLVLLSPAVAGDKFSSYVDKKGNISFPHGFRTSMVHLGSWFVPEGDASGFHDVYTEKETVQIYQKTGKFPDGATIVKELRTAESAGYTTGQNVSYATGSIKQWFVMIKDTKGRFASNPLWEMVGAGPYINQTIRVKIFQLITKLNVEAAMCLPKIRTGYI